MPRRKRERKMLMPPVIKGMSVYGVRGRKANEVNLLLEEYEVIRLLDHQGLNQEQAAVVMNVSRPTLTRIYEEARQKIASALVEGRDIIIKGGHVVFDQNWYKCNKCRANFNFYEGGDAYCPVCDSTEVTSLNDYFRKS
jgi:uncharacterized protein